MVIVIFEVLAANWQAGDPIATRRSPVRRGVWPKMPWLLPCPALRS